MVDLSDLALQRQLDAICDEFESDWQPDQFPDFRPYLAKVDQPVAGRLLKHLIEVDIELRLNAGLLVSANDYHAVHQLAPGLVNECLASLTEEGAGDIAHKSTVDSVLSETRLDLVDDPVPMTIGPYQLLHEIGQGGMGTVWAAEQRKPIHRQLAIKVIRAGLNSQQVIARFEAEQQALALMDHPNIARIVDAGTTENGQPFFAMELVHGQPVTTFCNNRKLGINDRLRLFIDVCLAVQHAHQKGIIHRDLKPSNVMVTEVDGSPVPKVIDFGLAKALENDQLNDQSQHTAIGQVLGTLKYMSPEQANLDTKNIDTRTDIYSLGVILYELLTGATPIDEDSVRDQPILQILENIRGADPDRPSLRLRGKKNALANVVQQRSTDQSSLSRILVGDLDWVVMQALDKDRSRRYQSASEFAADVRRFLNNEPVAARPPSASYRLQKFVRKNRAGVFAASLLAVALIAGITGTTLGLFRAVAAEDLAQQRYIAADEARQAESRRAQSEAFAKQQAESRLVQLKAANQILADIFNDLDIDEVKGGADPLEAVLAKRLVTAAGQFQGESVGDRLDVAELQNRLGDALMSLGYPKEAIEVFERSLDTRCEILGENQQDSLFALADLASAQLANGDSKSAVASYEKLLKIRTDNFGAGNVDVATAMHGLAVAYRAAGDPHRAIPLLEDVVKVRRSLLGEQDRGTLTSLNVLAQLYYDTGDTHRAIPLMEKVLELRRATLGKDHIETITTLNNLAAAVADIGDVEESILLYEEAFQSMKDNRGLEHPKTLATMTNLANRYKEAGKIDKAIPLLQDSVRLFKARLGDKHTNTLAAQISLAGAYHAQENYPNAIAIFEETLETAKSSLPENHPVTLFVMNNLAVVHEAAGEDSRAIELLEMVYERRKQKFGEDNPNTVNTMASLARAYSKVGSFELAIPMLEKALNWTRSNRINDHRMLVLRMNNLAQSYKDAGDSKKAIGLYEEAMVLSKAELGPDDRDTIGVMVNVAQFSELTGDLNRAESLFRQCVAACQKTTPDSWVAFETQLMLGRVLLRQGNYEAAESLLEAGYLGLKEREAGISETKKANFQKFIESIGRLYVDESQQEQRTLWRERHSELQF